MMSKERGQFLANTKRITHSIFWKTQIVKLMTLSKQSMCFWALFIVTYWHKRVVSLLYI